MGTKYHLLVMADGPPLAVAITGADRHDSMLMEPILDRLTPVKDRGRGVPVNADRESCTLTTPTTTAESAAICAGAA